MSNASVSLSNVSKFYGDVLGVNRVDLELAPGITGLVGPNGAGKSTLMNLIAGLLHPSRGEVEVLGVPIRDHARLFKDVGYCTQYDSFPQGVTALGFIADLLEVHGFGRRDARRLAIDALGRVGLADVALRDVESFSKGMRQRARLAQSVAHLPRVLVLDEPLNGLDPMARADVIDLLRDFADAGAHVLVSSHILHEVDLISDRVVFLNNGYVVAEGEVEGLQEELVANPMLVFIRSPQAVEIATSVFELECCVEARLHPDRMGVFVRTQDADAFFGAFNAWVVDRDWQLEAIGPADESVAAVYQHLVVEEQSATEEVA